MMGYLFLGAIVLGVVLWGPAGRLLKQPGWRIGSAMGAVVAFAGAAFCLVEKRWAGLAVFVVFGLWLATSARLPRQPRVREPEPPRRRDGMSASEARSILGVGEDATVADVRAAYKRLMRRVHPDHGGAAGLAAQLNAARDRLLK